MIAVTTEADLYERLPGFPWRKPVVLVFVGAPPLYACRVCTALRSHRDIARRGWVAFASPEAHAHHLDTEHAHVPAGRKLLTP